MSTPVIMAIAIVVIVTSGMVWLFAKYRWPTDGFMIQRQHDKELAKALAKWRKEWDRGND